MIVVDPGPLTTVQDGGRPGHLSAGIAPAGAADWISLRQANAILGNDPTPAPFTRGSPGAAGLECVLKGPRIRFESAAVVALTGGEAELRVDGRPQPNWEAVFVPTGAIVEVGEITDGARCYLGVAGGIDLEPVLGSRSTHLFGELGGTDGRPLARGDSLPEGAITAAHWSRIGARIPPQKRISTTGREAIRVVLGPQDHLVRSASVDEFLAAEWTLSPVANRMGFRFHGPRLEFNERPAYLAHDAGPDPSNIVDDVIPIGGIQVPSGSEAIVMGVENPTVGGFVKVATVISADLPMVGQLLPGARIHFAAIALQEALAIGENVLSRTGEAAVDCRSLDWQAMAMQGAA